LDDDFPKSMPTVQFVHPPFHPMIGADGVMQLHRRFPEWIPGETLLWQLLEYIKECFISPSATDTGYANDEACFLYHFQQTPPPQKKKKKNFFFIK